MRAPGFLLGILTLIFCGCAGQPAQPQVSPAPSLLPPAESAGPSSTSSPAPGGTPAASRTPVPPATAAPSSTGYPTAQAAGCSPLAGIALADLPKIISQPFIAPPPGQDSGHHGTDFAFYRWDGRIGIQGTPVQSVFAGRTAAVIHDRPPYGNAVIIETGWGDLPPGVQQLLEAPAPAAPDPRNIHLTCPGITTFDRGVSARPSLYLLYAHLEETPPVQLADQVACGQTVGAVGTTGSSVNPHLHLETRIGPAGAVFDSMAHYTASASTDEMTAYCTWRVSGEFVMLDPMRVLTAIVPP